MRDTAGEVRTRSLVMYSSGLLHMDELEPPIPIKNYQKLSKVDEPDMWDTAEEVRTSSLVMYSCGLLHMDELEPLITIKNYQN